ncbi:hypothetical protein [Nitrosomonas ureae]|uniref:Uncharacterized protein n=1 Tax=Nitrosomonas ureae TaxID=44577 RepID=A0A1H9EA49_9PROT|nr:hypothetical protein [Nitrosomonas ureae]SEQ22529.1 hypothetical protein SAMN05421510_102927 [Nitrosomonas ureae]
MNEENTDKISLKQNTQTLYIKDDSNKSHQRKIAETHLSPAILNTIAAECFTKIAIGEVDLAEAVEVMKEKSEKIISGDLSELESTLAAQVVTLNAIFITLARKSTNCEYLKQVETHLRLALKAQAQCARTVEVLAAMKNPPIVYVKQANIAQGHQQINNNESYAHAEKNINSANELLSEDNNATLDTGGTIKTSSINQELATVETINGSENIGR